jgi:GNAT superfamily N-acetyltransferase
MFVAALWVADGWRGRGVGGTLLAAAERHAAAAGCHSVWLDTFQARDFYLKQGYTVFGALEDYPPGQTRSFLRKRIA